MFGLDILTHCPYCKQYIFVEISNKPTYEYKAKIKPRMTTHKIISIVNHIDCKVDNKSEFIAEIIYDDIGLSLHHGKLNDNTCVFDTHTKEFKRAWLRYFQDILHLVLVNYDLHNNPNYVSTILNTLIEKPLWIDSIRNNTELYRDYNGIKENQPSLEEEVKRDKDILNEMIEIITEYFKPLADKTYSIKLTDEIKSNLKILSYGNETLW